MMIERVGIMLLIAGLSLSVYMLGTRWHIRSLQSRSTPDPLLRNLKPGIPAIIYFWSETCPPCKTIQKPALEQLQAELGPDGLQVIAVNASEQPGLADGWGVLGLPTTFVVDRHRQPRRVNHGITHTAELRQQITSLD